jgi:hypothetical protein
MGPCLGRDDYLVMAGLVPAIHVFLCSLRQDVDARDKPGHDVEKYFVVLSEVFVTQSPYASPSVSNIAALMASAADLPAQTTNWNAG